MKSHFFAVAALATSIGLLNNCSTYAQQSTSKSSESDEIIIRKKGDKNEKLTVEFKDGQVTVNGKPMSEYNDDDVKISSRKTRDNDVTVRSYGLNRTPGAPASPFQGGTFNFEVDPMVHLIQAPANTNRAALGVTTENVPTEKDDNGVKIRTVSTNSAAEKAGLKAGDVITKIDNTTIETPEDLTKAIGKFKPEDKTIVTYKRDKKEQKATVTLAKRTVAVTMYGQAQDNRNFNFDMLTPGADGQLNMIMRGNNLRLGLKAQDTEDGKGVKVLDVDDSSNAAKAGVKEGDIITEFNEKSINSVNDLMDAAKDMKDKNSIKVKISRDGKVQEVDIKVPKRLRTANL